MALDVNKLISNIGVTHYDFDPDATTATDIGWVDMRDFSSLMVSFFRTVGTSDITLSILANTKSDGSGDEATIVTKTITAQPNAVGDYVFLEALAQQIAQKASDNGKAYRYASASVSAATATDEGVVSYIRSGARYKHDDLTVDYVA